MRAFAELALAGFFVLWLIATAAFQAPSRLQDWLRQSEIFALVPRWHFFAPTPGVQDFTLIYRDQAADGSLSPWREVPVVTVPRQPINALWNPSRRHTKAMLDITKELFQLIAQNQDETEIKLSVPYLALLNYVSRLPRLGVDRFTQFALVMSNSSATTDPPAVVFVSALHEIE